LIAAGAHWKAGSDQAWSALYQDIDQVYPNAVRFQREPPTPMPAIPSEETSGADALNRIALTLDDGGKLGFNPSSGNLSHASVLGASIEDESGKFNANDLDTVPWATLLAHSHGYAQPTTRQLAEFGLLAEKLARVRDDPQLCPEGRIEGLDTLLEAEAPVNRPALLRAELDNMRRYLSVANRAVARHGRVDLGTVIGPNYEDYTAPSIALQFPVPRELTAANTALEYQDETGERHYFRGRPRGMVAPGDYFPGVEDIVAIKQPASLNYNQCVGPITHALNRLLAPPAEDVSAPVPPWPRPNHFARTLTALADLGPLSDAEVRSLGASASGFDLLAPVHDLEPIGWALPLQTPGLTATDLTGKVRPAVLLGASIELEDSGNLRGFPYSGYALIEATTITGQKYHTLIAYGKLIHGQPAHMRDISYLSGNALQSVFSDDAVITGMAPCERPMLAINSGGAVTVEGFASVVGRSGRHSAMQGRRMTAQAIPQERVLESAWMTQDSLHALQVARHGSLLATFPTPYQRAPDLISDMDDVGIAHPDPDFATGLRPATVKTIANGLIDWQWTRLFSGNAHERTGANFLATGKCAYPPTPGLFFDRSRLAVEGLLLSRSSAFDSPEHLSYPLCNSANGATGFFTHSSQGPGTIQPIDPRQFAIWIKPTDEWSGVVPIFELRAPVANMGWHLAERDIPASGNIIARQPGSDSSLQNYISLAYDVGTSQLILTMNNGAIEHVIDHGPSSPEEHFSLPTLDPHSLASGGAAVISPRQPWHAIETRYSVGSPEWGMGLRKGHWYHVHVLCAANAPGGMAIMVNGMVGRDLVRVPMSTGGGRRHGDNVTLPALVLRSELLSGDVRAHGSSDLLVQSIMLDAVDPVTGAPDSIMRYLPARGVVRIGDEYISYARISGNALIDCVRGRRQNTNQSLAKSDDTYANDAWPTLPAHHSGDLVVPGGYCFNPSAGRLFRGGCHLKNDFGNGDPNELAGSDRYTVWGILDEEKPGVLPPPLEDPEGLYRLPATASELHLKAGAGIPEQFPDHGIIRVDHAFKYYAERRGLRLLGLKSVNPAATKPAPLPNGDVYFKKGQSPHVTLVSMEVGGADPLEHGRYRSDGTECFLQILNLPDQRVEWIRYDHIANDGGSSYFIDHSGFARPARGCQRTFFAGDVGDGPGEVFKAESRVLPVQTAVPQSWIVGTGDIVTLAPGPAVNVWKHPQRRPFQVCVRYSACDGFSGQADTASAAWDTHDEYFAFSEELPAVGDPEDPDYAQIDYTGRNYSLLCWPCWGGDDLSPLNPIPRGSGVLSRNLMPWGTVSDPDFLSDADDERRLYIGSQDDRPAWRNDGVVASMAGMIDAVLSGPQTGDVRVLAFSKGTVPITRSPAIQGHGLADLDAAESDALIVVADEPIFANMTGLALIGGEVFAFRGVPPPPNRERDLSKAILIGRAQLGSAARAHNIGETILILPHNPVGILRSSLPKARIGYIEHATYPAPALIISSPDGADSEIVELPNQCSAPWLRGMYNSVSHDWDKTGNLAPITIGFWPRYSSALPEQSSTANLFNPSAMLRSRSYAWAGFPMRFFDCRFDAELARSAALRVLDTADGMFALEARALSDGFDWNNARAVDLGDRPGDKDASRVFDHEQFHDASGSVLPVDGAELRIHWRYSRAPTNDLAEMADNGNAAPTLGPVRLRGKAPCKVLGVESAR
jgi:hypothetical protein